MRLFQTKLKFITTVIEMLDKTALFTRFRCGFLFREVAMDGILSMQGAVSYDRK